MTTPKSPEERWKPIGGYEGIYEVSDLGRVKRLRRRVKANIRNNNSVELKEMIIKSFLSPIQGGKTGDGYFFSTLMGKDRKQRRRFIHRLVAFAFLENPEGKSTVNHKDGNKKNNHVDNLEWVTPSENIKHSFRLGLNKPKKGETNSQAKLNFATANVIREMAKTTSNRQIAKIFHVSRSTIDNIVHNKIYTEDLSTLLIEEARKVTGEGKTEEETEKIRALSNMLMFFTGKKPNE